MNKIKLKAQIESHQQLIIEEGKILRYKLKIAESRLVLAKRSHEK